MDKGITLLGHKVNRRGAEVVMVFYAKAIPNRRCGCVASCHGEGHRKGAVFRNDADRDQLLERLGNGWDVAKTNDIIPEFCTT
jgi:hypothetical protein